MIISGSNLLRTEMCQTKLAEKIRTQILFSMSSFSENRALYEIMLENTAELGRPQMTIRHMRIACWVTEDTNTHTHTHTEYEILIIFHTTTVARKHLNVTSHVHCMFC
jgi:hypothetical protein